MNKTTRITMGMSGIECAMSLCEGKTKLDVENIMQQVQNRLPSFNKQTEQATT